MRFVLALLIALAAAPCTALAPFFAPPVTTGSIEVRLHPTEVVAPGNPVRVTFGLPFPRGSITAAQLSTVRVYRNGTELPAAVVEATPWRHRVDPNRDGTSVRVAHVQFLYSFGGSASEPVTVDWGVAPRAASIAFASPRSAWHAVTSGSFQAADNVTEPDVYATLPADWLSRGLLDPVPAAPFDAANPPTRDDPATNDAIASWPGYQEAERALKNNFYTVINRDDPAVTVANQCPYRTVQEPWLYDRAATMFALYRRSGSFLALREAVQATQFYAARVNAQGFFSFANNDSKYAYNESLAEAYWLTGDDTLLAPIDRVATAQASFAPAWTPSRGFWTERHAAFRLLGQTVAWEVLGGAARASAVDATLAAYRTHQNGANGQIPVTSFDGGLYHYGSQHDFDWAETAFGGSSWMSALLADAALRAWAGSEDAPTADFIIRLGRFMAATVVDTTGHPYGGGVRASPRYAMLIDGSDGQRDDSSDVEHALDVAAQIAWADYLARLRGTPDATLRQRALDLYATYDAGVNHWIRPAGPGSGLPAFRVSPWRKWGWEHRISEGIAVALTEDTGEAVLFADGFE